MKLCECGCGRPTRVSPRSNARYGYVRGEPRRFVRGHCHRGRGEDSPSWKGGSKIEHGYRFLFVPTHPNADAKGYVAEHVLVVATALGKAVPPSSPVHHANRDRLDNRPRNLVLCDSHAYHRLLHQRLAAFESCGHADWRKCQLCGRYDAPDRMYSNPGNGACRHRACQATYVRMWSHGMRPSQDEIRRTTAPLIEVRELLAT